MKTLISKVALAFGFVSLLLLAIPVLANDEEMLMGRWKGEWYSYTRLRYTKMELEVTSISPLKGELYKTHEAVSKREPFASVGGETKNGKIFLEFVGPDGYQWNFELSLKGKTLEGDGKTWGLGPFGARWFYTNLKLEKAN